MTATRILKHTLTLALVTLALLGVLFVYFFFIAPRSGASAEGQRLSKVESSPNYSDGEFQNPIPTVLGSEGTAAMAGAIYDWLFSGAKRAPDNPLPVGFNSNQFTLNDSSITVTWFGHSTVLVSFENKNILFDPMFAESAAPIPFLGARFPVQREFDINALPELDAVVISHDHYDHLDHESVQILNAKSKRFFAPLGVGAHLESWGIPPEKITELDWWQSAEFFNLKFTSTPARHFSGRGLPASNSTLWGSWVITGSSKKIFFSGDSGYFPGFKEIGQRLGPFDFCMVECGQYSENWPDVHMSPEQTVQAFLDLRGELLMPIHWSAFDLSLHAWNEPPTRMLAASESRNVRVALPLIGQTFDVANPPQTRWWQELD